MRNPFGITLDKIPSPCTFTNPGSDIYVLHELSTDESGQECLVETGRQSISTMINAWKDCTDMSYILARLNAGDASVLDMHPEAFYGDVSDMPYDHRAALTAIQNARTYFDNLPAETRQKFGDSFENWFSEAGDAGWIKKMMKEPEAAPVAENPEKESE